VAQALAVQRVVGAFLAGFLEPHGLRSCRCCRTRCSARGRRAAARHRLPAFRRPRRSGRPCAGRGGSRCRRRRCRPSAWPRRRECGGIGGGKQRTADHATRQAGLGERRSRCGRRSLRPRVPPPGAGSCRCRRGPAHGQASALVVRGLGGHQAAGAAQHVLAHALSAHEGRGGGSAMPRRCSSDSAVSLLRVCSERYREKPGASEPRGQAVGQRFDGIAHQFGGQSAASGPSDATANAPPPPVSSTAPRRGDALGVFLGGLGQAIKQSRPAVVKP
jgi:hypothetical protein